MTCLIKRLLILSYPITLVTEVMSASEVTTVWRYRNSIIIIIINVYVLRSSSAGDGPTTGVGGVLRSDHSVPVSPGGSRCVERRQRCDTHGTRTHSAAAACDALPWRPTTTRGGVCFYWHSSVGLVVALAWNFYHYLTNWNWHTAMLLLLIFFFWCPRDFYTNVFLHYQTLKIAFSLRTITT